MARIGKTELINKVSESSKRSKVDTTAFINAFIKEITKAMKNGDEVVIPDFGAFKIQKVKARKGRNLKTGEQINIPEKKRVKFTPGKKLAESANEN